MFHKLGNIQIGGDDRGFLPQYPLVKAQKQLGTGEGIGKLRSKIINDQQVAVKQILIVTAYGVIFVKRSPLENAETGFRRKSQIGK